MDEKQAIISQIISSAEATAKSIVEGAQAEQDRTLASKAELDEKKNSAVLAKAKKNAEESVNRTEMLARLDSKKYILGVRQKAISEVYVLAVKNLSALDDDKYRKLFSQFVLQYASDGDLICVCEKDKKRLNEKWLNDCAAEKGIKLGFGENHSFNGGIIIRGSNCDINCTLESLVSRARDNTEKKVAEILFGNNG